MTNTGLGNAEASTTDHGEDHRPHVAARNGSAWTSAMGKVGWGVLLAISIVGVLNHLLAVFTFATTGEEQQMFALFAGINAYAIAVLASPYRQHQRWAWFITWLEVAAFASVLPLIGGGVGWGYLVVAVVAGLAQLAALPSFLGAADPVVEP